MKEKSKDKKTSRNQALKRKSHQWSKHLGSSSCKTLGTILKIDKRGTQTNESKEKEIDDHSQGLISER